MITSAAAIFTGPGRPLELRQLDVPELRDGEILVRITVCTLCGSDLHSFDGRRVTGVPMILGHEILGRIAAFGPAALRNDAEGQSLEIGDRITWSLVASCGSCFYCNRGLPQKCERSVKYGHEPLAGGHGLSGGLAEYCVLARGTTIIHLPDSLVDEAACPANCATATAAAAIAAAGDLPDRAALITGAGLLGLTACAMARSLGASAVISCDTSDARRKQSGDFGATSAPAPDELPTVVEDVTGSHGVDAFIEMSGSPQAFESALPLVRLGGTIVLVGAVFPTRPISLGMETIVRRNLRIIGVHNYAPADCLRAVQFLRSHPEFPFEKLVSKWLPLAAANEAFAAARDAEVVRIGVACDGRIAP